MQKLIAIAVLFAAVIFQTAAAQELKWFTFAQLTASSTEIDSSVAFGADSVRAGFNVGNGNWSGRLVLDFNAGNLSTRPPGTLPNIVKDVFATYSFGNGHELRFGQFKVPLGMDFLQSGAALDLTKRGMEKGLVLERDLGVAISGRKLGNGFGYDVGVFNPAGRSAATSHAGSGATNQTGDDVAMAGRLTFDDSSEQWHAELAVGTSQDAGGPGTKDYQVIDLGLVWRNAPWVFKAEYIDGKNVQGSTGRDERVWYGHAEYAISPHVTGLVRHYSGQSDIGAASSDLDNTFIGVTLHLDEQRRSNNRIMVNYVIAGGDKNGYTGVSGYRGNAVLAQYQFHFVEN